MMAPYRRLIYVDIDNLHMSQGWKGCVVYLSVKTANALALAFCDRLGAHNMESGALAGGGSVSNCRYVSPDGWMLL